MRIFYVGFNDYYHTASIHLEKVPAGLYYLSEFVMWICVKIPSIPFPNFISWKSPEGRMSMREWFGDLQQWFHVNVCTHMFYFVRRHTKSTIIPLPYHYLKKLFPEYFESSSEWDDDDRMFRQLTRELSWKNEDEFNEFSKKLDYEHIKRLCDVQVNWYNKLMEDS